MGPRASLAPMKAFAAISLAMVALAVYLAGCAWLNKPAPPACQGDPALKSCSCMDARTPGCPPPLNDDAKRPTDGGSH